MEEPDLSTRMSSFARAPADPEPAPKRRKLRKGTRSCWECKRRKARCTFAVDAEDFCDGCRRRGTDCISQEDAERPPPPGSNRHLVDRLGRVEALVGGLLKAARNNGRLGEYVASPARSESESQQPDDRERRRRPRTSTRPSSSPFHAPTTGRYDDLCRDLLTAWPSPRDMDTILAIPVETSSIIRAVTCTQPTVSTENGIPSPTALLQLPPPGCHPVLIARKLLILATFLQGIPSSHAKHLRSLCMSRDEMMARAVKTAHSLVTCNDDFLGSAEGIECILLESLYENYAGNLRRSWLAIRRAVTIAQMLGLDRGTKPAALAGAVIEPDHMWFRVIQFDRYLCLMLGLPQSIPEDSFASPESLAPCPAAERFQRLTCAASGRLLRRHHSEMYDPIMTKEIDGMLQDASAKMPAQWWVTPNLMTCSGHMERIRETLRFNDHFMHYYLLVQLHLPYLVRPGSRKKHLYNRMTALAASREVLSRLVSFRTCLAVGYYCRGMDFLAFISSTALCLAHINDQHCRGMDEDGSHFLTHQRLSDRGILEQTLEIMHELASLHNDAIANEVSTLLQHLLAIEEDVALGGTCNVAFSSEGRGGNDLGCGVKLSDDSTVLRIYLPHLRVINIERQISQTRTRPFTTQSPELNTRGARDPDEPLGATQESEHNRVDMARGNEYVPRVEPLAEDDSSKDPASSGDAREASFFLDHDASTWVLQDLDLGFLHSLVEPSTELEAQGSL